MFPSKLLHHLREIGCKVQIQEDGSLGVTPVRYLTPDTTALLMRHREALLDLLDRERVLCYDPPDFENQASRLMAYYIVDVFGERKAIPVDDYERLAEYQRSKMYGRH